MLKPLHGLLSEKQSRPILEKIVIPRTSLFARLDQGLEKRFILISAPAGYGKTCLANAWTSQQNGPVAWFALDDSDNDPTIFFSNLLYAIKNGVPNLDLDEELLQFDEDHPGEAEISEILSALLENLPSLILVLDDYHNIVNPLIHRAVSLLIANRNRYFPLSDANAPAGNPVVGILPMILSRSDPPFHIARMRMKKELLEIRAEDLKFSFDECQAFLDQSAMTRLTPPQVHSILNKTEGWIAGLHFAAISFHEQYHDQVEPFLQGFSGRNPLIADYWISEVFSSLSVPLQSFILHTAFLDTMCGPLCDEIRGSQDSQEFLEQLEKHNLFIINLDYQRTWFRYHHLLKEYLSKRIGQMDPAEIVRGRRLAAGWFERNGLYKESIHHAILAGEVEQAVHLITEKALTLLFTFQVHYLRQLLGLFREGDYAAWPWLSIYRAWTNVCLDTGRENFWLGKAERAIQSRPAPPEDLQAMRDNMLAIRILGAARRGDVQTTLALLPGTKREKENQSKMISDAAMNSGSDRYSEGLCSMITEDLNGAYESFNEAKLEALIAGNISLAAEVIGAIGELNYLNGRLHAAAVSFKEAITLQDTIDQDLPTLSRAYSGLGQVYYEWNYLDEALKNMLKGYCLSKSSGAAAQIYSGTVLANAYLHIDDLENAQALFTEMDEILASHPQLLPFVESQWASCRLRLLVAQKDFRKAQNWIDERGIQTIADTDSVRETEKMSLVRFYLATGEIQAAIALIEQYAGSIQKRGRTAKFIRLSVQQAYAYQLVGDQERANQKLIEALSCGKAEGFIRRFMDYDDNILDTLVQIAHMERSRLPVGFDLDYVEEIIQALVDRGVSVGRNCDCVQEAEPIGPVQDLFMAAPLTVQEKKILHLIAVGYDNFQIADAQHIALNTVKSHIFHIYNKLGVHTRVQAVNQARLLGIRI